MTQTQRIERHGGYWICRDPEDGYYWRNGKDGDGYFDDIADCRASIDDYNAERLEIDRMEGRLPEDAIETALPDPWWMEA